MAEARTSYDAYVEFLSTPMSDERPFVLETQHAVSLHFDHFATQSFMSLRHPDKLTLDYTCAMMGFLLVQPAPEHICMIGLGGGSLAKFCYRNLPEAAIDAVEISPEVIALRDVFRIPADDARFKVVCADGADYVMLEDVRTDVILLDAFVTEGIASRCADIAFFDACRERLTDAGVLVINFTDDDPALPLHVERLKAVFGSSCSIVRCGDDSNFVAFAWKGGRRLPSRRVLLERARSFAFAGELELAATAARLKQGERLDPERLAWHAQGAAHGHWIIGA
ncbi:hypothetical protein [Burkholderia ubonensis]|uniref:spermine/spermidine synthase domain-containing protein n=1 Tax=Burkholderia ubonensis TaxID=101571 RepID=UPI000755BDE1|nr:hypothetical protein [Burkholderia ubonensis]KVZ96270.1 spermidine synthase [Burkholderia ubonensis]KWE22053.1 spermidine synthase [Burkholderia ubonensis]